MSSHKQQNGFALLLTMIIVGVVLSVGLTILNITVKQFSLSVTGRESEVAFHVAGAMLECALLHRLDDSLGSKFEDGTGTGPDDLACGTGAPPSNDRLPGETTGTVHRYLYQYSYPTGGGACGEISMYVLDATGGAVTANFTGEGLINSTCASGNICTVAFTRGFNRDCSNLGSIQTVQREFSVRF